MIIYIEKILMNPGPPVHGILQPRILEWVAMLSLKMNEAVKHVHGLGDSIHVNTLILPKFVCKLNAVLIKTPEYSLAELTG